MSDQTPVSKDLHNVVLLGYALQAVGLITGGLGNLIAVVLAYVKRDDAHGTPYASHIQWQINTFWLALLGYFIGFVTIVVVVGFAILFATTVWLIYRIVKGWISLNEGKSPYPLNTIN